MLTAVGAGITVEALITVGETAGDEGYVFESIPDGISIKARGKGTVEVYVNHETSRVPFPYPLPPGTRPTANAQNDFDNAQLSRLILNQKSAGVQTGKLVITSDENYQRFCSNYLATAAEGFDRELLFTNEETPDWVNRSGNAWPTTVGASTAREAGVVVAYDPKTGKNRPIWGMGRHNHENAVPIPGFDDLVLLSGDDTFTNNPSQSQLYSYIAPDCRRGVERRRARSGRSRRTTRTTQVYEDFVPGDTTSITGHFIEVPRLIATGRKADGTELMAADVPASLGGPFPAAAHEQRLAARSGHRHRRRRPAVGARVLVAAERRVRLRAGRGHRLRQAAGHVERRLHRRLRSRRRQPAPPRHPCRRSARTLDQRTGLEDGPRPDRSQAGHVAVDPDRGRRHAGQGP